MSLSWHSVRTDPIVASNVVIAIATVVNLVVAIFVWRTTAATTELAKKSFDAGYRPYLGSENTKTKRDPERNSLDFWVIVKNFGNVPAEGDMQWTTILNGQEMPMIHVPRKPNFFFPGQETEMGPGYIRDGQYDAVMNGTSVLEFCIWGTYHGVEGTTYSFSTKGRYLPNQDVFSLVGGCGPQQ